MSELIRKYDGLAENFAQTEYKNLEFDMLHRFDLAVGWGSRLAPGDRVLELGCGDGYLALMFASCGYRYWGADLSPRMVETAKERVQRAGCEAAFAVCDVSALSLDTHYDAVIAYMRAFFTYMKNPSEILHRVRPLVRKKIILDLNPRGEVSLRDGLALLRASGFRRVAWRPFFVPKERRLPACCLKTLVMGEEVPLIRSLPLRWKFNCLLLGEP